MQLTTEIRDRDSALAYLYSRIDFERAATIPYQSDLFKLDRMRELLDRLGNPEAGMPIVHLAGTKGKGSTAGMIASVLSSAGYRTGLYTSPHLQRVEERFAIDGAPCPPETFVELMRRVRGAVDDLDREAEALGAPKTLTFFEITTALALLHFATARVDAAVLEVGLGGRLDSTNVCAPRVSVITTISFDHTRQLGNTLPAIAGEKAGIIKPGVPVITGVVEPEPKREIERIARERGAPLFALDDCFGFSYLPASVPVEFDYWERLDGHERRLDKLTVGLLGRHQAANASVAVAALGRLEAQGWRIPEAAIRAGLLGVRCPARIEIVSQQPTVLVDVAHNVAAIEALCQALDERFPAGPRLLVFAASRDKDAAGMLRLILPRFERVIFTKFLDNPRGYDPESLQQIADELRRERPGQIRSVSEVCPSPADAWNRARELATPEHLVCITGSFFIAGEMQAVMNGA